MSLPSVVLAPFASAYDLFSISYHGRLVEALSEHVSDQGFGCGMVTIDPTVDIAQQMLPPFDRDVALQDSNVTLLVEFALHKNKGLGVTCEPSSLHLVHRQHITEVVVEVGCSLVDQRVRLYHWILFKLYDFGTGWSRWLVSPRA